MKSQRKELTAPVPHRIMKKTSIYLAEQCKVDREDFLGYEAVVPLSDGQKIIIQSGANLSAKDGRVFDYVLSQWFATKKTQSDLKGMEVYIPSVLQALGQVNRTETRKKIIAHLKRMANVTIIYKWQGGEMLFHMLDTVTTIDATNMIKIKVSDTYEKALDFAKSRFINVSKAMELKSAYAIELSKLLQANGSGVTRDGEPEPPKEILHVEICKYLYLDPEAKRSTDEVRRAFKELKKVGYPIYGLRGRLWKNLDYIKRIKRKKQ